MPAWMTSELRELVWVPIASSASRITTSRPAIASARATARPTTPAPTTTASSFSTRQPSFGEECAQPGKRGRRGQRARAAVEGGAEEGADQRAANEGDGAEQRGGRARGRRERRQRGGGRVRGDQRGAGEEDHERQYDRGPVRHAGPGEERGEQ